MRAFLVVLLCLVSSTAAAQTAAHAGRRAKIIASLERLMVTGEPRDTDHDEGQWLQAAVLAAIQQGDEEIHRLAIRAAVPLVPRVSRPVSPTDDFQGFGVEAPEVLKLPRRVRFTAEISASVDGGETFLLQVLPNQSGKKEYPPSATQAGLHHVRLQARITYENDGGLVVPPETRNLPEIAYAIYDPKVNAQFDARVFALSPAWVKANKFDPTLPQEPFASWLATTLAPYGIRRDSPTWATAWCDERVVEAGTSPRSSSVCALVYFSAEGTIGRIWFRTGRVEFLDSEVRWLVEAPVLDSVQLLRSAWSETDTLSALPGLLAGYETTWPFSDVSVAPEDILVTPAKGGLHISATIRNAGTMDARGVYVMVTTGVVEGHGVLRGFVVDVPARGEALVRLTQPFSSPYGVVLVTPIQASEHSPFDGWHPDPTPEDTVAFRVFNPKKAPKGYADVLRNGCAPICRGY